MPWGPKVIGNVADEIQLVERAADARRATAGEGSDLPFLHVLRLEDVSFRDTPDGPWVLQHVDFEFPRGESIGTVGTTGGGKSTIADVIHLALGLEPDEIDESRLWEVAQAAQLTELLERAGGSSRREPMNHSPATTGSYRAWSGEAFCAWGLLSSESPGDPS